MRRPHPSRLCLALSLSVALHAAFLLAHGRLGGQEGRRQGAPLFAPFGARIAGRAALPSQAPAAESAPPPLERAPSSLAPREAFKDGSAVPSAAVGAVPGLIGAPGFSLGPRFIDEPVIPDERVDRLRELGDVDLALTVERDGRVSRIEVLRPELGLDDYGWISAMITEARILPGSVDGVAVGSRWLIRICAPEPIHPVTG